MPRQEKNKPVQKTVKVAVEREYVDQETFDVLRIDGKEIVAFHVTNIDALGLEHTNQTMSDAVSDYLTKNSEE